MTHACRVWPVLVGGSYMDMHSTTILQLYECVEAKVIMSCF